MFAELPEIAVVKAIGFYVLVGVGRPFGFLTTFTLIAFTLNKGRMLRVAMALAFAGPVIVANQLVLYDVYIRDAFADRIFMPLKEVALGLMFGFIASLPFYAFKYAGALVDNYRGESSNGIQFEGSEKVTTAGIIFYLVLFIVFIANDGLWRLFEVFYLSYQTWPIQDYLPPFSADAALVLIMGLSDTFLLMIQVGLPFLLMLFFAEMSLMIASRLGQKFGLNSSSFLIKNVAFIFVLPLYVVFVVRTAEVEMGRVLSAAQMLGKVFE